jgi:hypothetical protein
MFHDPLASRRGFIQSAAGMGIAAAAPEPRLPKVKFFKPEVTRLITGAAFESAQAL